MILTDGVIVRCRFAIGNVVVPGTVTVHADSVEAAHREVLLHASELPEYEQQPINILGTEVVLEIESAPQEGAREQVYGLREGLVVEADGKIRSEVVDDGAAS